MREPSEGVRNSTDISPFDERLSSRLNSWDCRNSRLRPWVWKESWD